MMSGDLMQQRQRLLQGGGGLFGSPVPTVNPTLPGAGHPYFAQMQGIDKTGVASRGPFERYGGYTPPATNNNQLSADQLTQQLLQLGLLRPNIPQPGWAGAAGSLLGGLLADRMGGNIPQYVPGWK